MTAFEQIWGRVKQTGIGGLIVVARAQDTQMLREIARACGRDEGDLIVCSEIPHTTTE
jgi:hypothetical protein